MSDIVPLNARNLSFKIDGNRCNLEFDGEYLTCTVHARPAFQTTKTPLWRIMPELLTDRSIPDSSRRHGRIGRYSFLSSIVVYFSDIRLHVPLLAPTLLLLSVYSLYRGFRAVYPSLRTKIVSEWGDEIAVIPHHEDMDAQRKRFEDTLLEAVLEARHKHYEA